MLPLRDNIPARQYPFVTVALISVNLAVFLQEIHWGRQLHPALFEWGIVPVRYTRSDVAQFFGLFDQILPFFTSLFLHGGWVHLLGNMWTLWIFGDNVEDRLGRGRFLLLYLTSGIAASLLHIITNPQSSVPAIGASGALAGIMGAYFRFFPHARVTMLIPPFFLGPFFQVPAVLFLGWWFLLQFFNGTLSLLSGPKAIGGVAWWAHVGGFIFGAALCLKFRPQRRGPDFPDEVIDV
ncbi:MAG TPA: rhomboid family intramembrane serine protease [Candidatus Paceibacterota bacterium]|nr:rhomboid family intramembrane serine protease [Verrucomicrobiota bacterium]HRY48918.1 rhomboid family intramembrane serine protease [Candidatus Paceibacterota bacterium]HRZ99130.1 rhomboid family intramembrane serine protease [Candidatus Paceibacterota bacterium]